MIKIEYLKQNHQAIKKGLSVFKIENFKNNVCSFFNVRLPLLAHFCKVCQCQVVRTKGQAMPVSKLRAAPPGQSPAGKNPHPFSSAHLALWPLSLSKRRSLSMPKCWVCKVFLPASAQSTLLLFFFCHTFCNPPTIGTLLFLVPQKNQ